MGASSPRHPNNPTHLNTKPGPRRTKTLLCPTPSVNIQKTTKLSPRLATHSENSIFWKEETHRIRGHPAAHLTRPNSRTLLPAIMIAEIGKKVLLPGHVRSRGESSASTFLPPPPPPPLFRFSPKCPRMSVSITNYATLFFLCSPARRCLSPAWHGVHGGVAGSAKARWKAVGDIAHEAASALRGGVFFSL